MTTKTATATTNLPGAQGAEPLTHALRAALGEPVLLCVWASTQQPLAALLPALQERFPRAVVVGSSTAGEFTAAGDTKGCAVVFGVAGDVVAHAGFGGGLKASTEKALQQALAELPTSVDGHPHRAALLLFDGLVGVGEEVTLQASLLLGEDVKVAGAAAGDDGAVSRTEVGVGNKSGSDSVVVVSLHAKAPFGLGVRHGHNTAVTAPMTVTRAHDNLVVELDGKPAFSRFAEVVRAESDAAGYGDLNAVDDAARLFAFFVRFVPALRIGDGWRNRTILMKNPDRSLGFTCGIAEGTRLTVVKSDPAQQLESARAAAKDAVADLGGGSAAGGLVFDCICRKTLLGDDFTAAAAAIASEVGAPIGGFESYGEVALRAGDFSGFHNSTTVVLVFGA